VIAASATAIGAIFAVPVTGNAARAAVPANSGTPTISGTPQQGATLTADNGTWSNSPTNFAYSWARCDKDGNACVAVTGATNKTYQPQQADVGGTLRVTVTASNADGAAQATSAPTAVVSAAAAPVNTAPPTISGTAAVGATLTASNGNWNGSPTGYGYAWQRCDQNGASCAAIGGATAQTYKVAAIDAGATIRVAVTATNGAGSTQVTSVPTGIVPATVSNGCPTSGNGTLAVSDVAPPARLVLDQQTITPGVVTPAARTIQLHARVTACNGRPVQGALVYATAVPYNQYTVPPEATTGADGSVTVTMSQLSGFPAARRQQLLVVFLRARKPGDPTTSGISTRLLVSFRVRLH
jgi:hypothetical protein